MSERCMMWAACGLTAEEAARNLRENLRPKSPEEAALELFRARHAGDPRPFDKEHP